MADSLKSEKKTPSKRKTKPVGDLLVQTSDAEASVKTADIKHSPVVAEVEKPILVEAFERCPHCGTDIRLGYTVCPGCQAERCRAGILSGLDPLIRGLFGVGFALCAILFLTSLFLGWFAAGFLSLGALVFMFLWAFKQDRVDKWVRVSKIR